MVPIIQIDFHEKTAIKTPYVNSVKGALNILYSPPLVCFDFASFLVNNMTSEKKFKKFNLKLHYHKYWLSTH